MNIPNIRAGAIPVHRVKDIAYLIMRHKDLSSLGIDSLERLCDGLRQVIQILLGKEKRNLVIPIACPVPSNLRLAVAIIRTHCGRAGECVISFKIAVADHFLSKRKRKSKIDFDLDIRSEQNVIPGHSCLCWSAHPYIHETGGSTLLSSVILILYAPSSHR
jgi:hypothetical protein